jgi:hypothetical protein
MKSLKAIPSLLFSFLIGLSAAAQNSDGPTINDRPLSDQIAAARRRYTETTDVSSAPGDGKALAQLGRPPLMPRHGYYQNRYQNSWTGPGDVDHPLIGAAIGFGFGAAIGALGAIHGHTPVGSGVLIGGSLFGFIGGAIGLSHGGLASSMHRRRSDSPWPDEDEESRLRSPSQPKEGQPEPSVLRTTVVNGEPAEIQASASPSPARLAVP